MTDELIARIGEALRVVIDPELGENIVELGFIYDISVSDGAARITMTATTPGCPATGFLKERRGKQRRASPGRHFGRRGDDVRSTVDSVPYRAVGAGRRLVSPRLIEGL